MNVPKYALINGKAPFDDMVQLKFADPRIPSYITVSNKILNTEWDDVNQVSTPNQRNLPHDTGHDIAKPLMYVLLEYKRSQPEEDYLALALPYILLMKWNIYDFAPSRLGIYYNFDDFNRDMQLRVKNGEREEVIKIEKRYCSLGAACSLFVLACAASEPQAKLYKPAIKNIINNILSLPLDVVIKQPVIINEPESAYSFNEVEREIGIKAENERKLVFSPYSDYTMYDSDGSSLFVDYFNALNNEVNNAVQISSQIKK